jgi:hypothetical protein
MSCLVGVDYKGVAGLGSRQNTALPDVFILKSLENGPTRLPKNEKAADGLPRFKLTQCPKIKNTTKWEKCKDQF